MGDLYPLPGFWVKLVDVGTYGVKQLKQNFLSLSLPLSFKKKKTKKNNYTLPLFHFKFYGTIM